MKINVASLKIVKYPNPVLRRPTVLVADIDDIIKNIAIKMIDLMYEANGVGLAAPQVGLSLKLFVANSHQSEDETDLVYINPQIIKTAGDPEPHEEGCLSIPEVYGDVRRPPAVTITATGLNGKQFTLSSNTALARVWQHEFDHLNGKLILDHFTRMTKLANRKAIRQLERDAEI